jgi:hypothetical protein
MRRFVVRQNIERFEHLLRSECDDRARRQLEVLLAEARAELRYLEHLWWWTCPELAIPDGLGAEAEHLLDEVVAAHRADFASLQVWDDASRSLRLIGHRNFDRSSVDQFAVVRPGCGSVCEAACITRARVVIEDMETANDFAALREWTAAIGISAIQTTPMFDRQDRLLGAFSTHFTRPHRFSIHDHAVSDQYAQKIGDVLMRLPSRQA